MIELSLQGISKYYGAVKVLENISFELYSGDRVGMVGRNGTGKTTILKVIYGIENYNDGNLSISKGKKVGYLDQIPDYPDDYKVIDVLNIAFEEVLKIKCEMEKLEKDMSVVQDKALETIMKKYSDLQVTFEHLGGYEISEKLSKVCIGFNIDEEYKQRKFIELSGGEKTTVILAKILLENPDILLLDEPTNHLDVNSIEWLEEYLKDYNGCVLIISHDRYFLDKTVNKIIDIENGKAKVYKGNYSSFIDEKEKQRKLQLEAYNRQQKKIGEMQEAVKRFRDWGTRADNEAMFKKAFNMEKRIEKMDKIDKPQNHKKLNINFSLNQKSSNDIVRVEDIDMSYGDKIIFKQAGLIVKAKERIGIIGKNGCGKSTLLKLILGEETPKNGLVKLGSGVKFGFLEQEITFEDSSKTILDYIREMLKLNEFNARNLLAKFMFYKDDVFKKISTLSGGEKVRLKLCIMLEQDVNTLILDEPTNHLDIESREMLENGLSSFEGTIIFISHDRYFINKIANKIAEVNNYKLKEYLGNYNYYNEKKSAVKEIKETKKKKTTVKERSNEDSKRKIKLRKLEKMESLIQEHENKIIFKEKEMKSYASDYEKLEQIYKEIETLKNELNELMNEWIELSS
ncbi:ribosomal protection-like ABC-F family protein [Abyssisolibacter fermentans]|uniref:ribosomal protection-like ABC-F family protein n=1 Tax=Abyssisolibacter fermentans TaxID=1766203 RepID=UPI0008321ABF|nr:ABC-F type ribosomal protection protein [Abyssisolibacter fermentans]